MIEPPPTLSLSDLVAWRARSEGDRAAITDVSGTWTYSELLQWSERIAAGLASVGVDAGTTVSWQLPTRAETVALVLAIDRLGAIQNPLVPLYRFTEVSAAVDQLSPKLLIVADQWRGFDHAAMAAEIARGRADLKVLVTDGRGLPQADARSLPPLRPASAPHPFVFTTSGTTSAPKCVRHTTESLFGCGRGMTYAMRPLPEDVFGMPFPIAHIGGLASFIAMVEVGGCMVLVDPFVPDEAVAFMRRHAITICGGAAPHFAALLEEQRKHPTGALLPTMRMGCGGGAPRDRELHHRLVAEMGVPLVYGYGMTECGTICMPTLDDTDEQLSYTEGLPVPGVELRIVDDGDATLPDGTEGEIHVRGTPVCDGYVDPETTAQAFTDDGWLRTGDRGRIRPDGRLVLTGRSKDLIIRKGENISAQEIEMVLMAMDAVLGVAVIGLPDRERGERVCAVVEARVGVAPPTLEDVVAHCRSHRLMVQKFPEQLEIVELLPRNSMLKVMKAQLRERFASSDDAGARP